ncbi:hypothetical protein MmiHf6_11320 [Methanimicrococcus hongohii]|uniref:CobW/HypB/UreG nucleotide-binding domain-containing protein n=1 Tax=Methanimicrococcus hongohii TaxID=3028295 RepID=A0AA96ZU23_9EURY|nr:GTP-binding protein [Methanimicrococcus sp. Hf6]WNY23811.1 hypothetical protein MmiHf6_11320 [Methanimicrococcus sp. Hf6]
MKVLLIGGFLESGKTTTVLKFIDRLAADGKKVALIINEVGEVSVDDAALEAAGISSKELTNGCICCTLVINLRETVTEIVNTRNPDILIIEMPGLALPSHVRDELLEMNMAMSLAPVVTLIDASRFTVGLSHVPNFTEHQLGEAEIIAINKIDLVDEEKIKSIESFLKKMNPDAYAMRMSAINDDAAIDKMYELVMRKSNETVSRIDMPKEMKPKVTEESNSIEITNVTECSELYNISGELTAEAAGALLKNMISVVGAEISKMNIAFGGNIEMTVRVDDTLVKVSHTAGVNDGKIEAEYIRQENGQENPEKMFGKTGCYELCFSAAVTNVKKDELEKIADQSVNIFLAAKKLAVEKQIQKGEMKKSIATDNC